ncbi:MAG TPA: hypothetical protein VMV88_05575 [Gallionella sp.]|nr:hypothetical protein [Gallionella sp.]
MDKTKPQPKNLAVKSEIAEVFMKQLPENLLLMIYEAKNGDTIAARNTLILLTGMLSSTRFNQFTGEILSEPLEIPEWVRSYLAQSFTHILEGQNADKALNLKRNGRPTAWSYYPKLAAAQTVHFYHTHSAEKKTIEESCATVADGINSLVARVNRTLLESVGLGHFIGKSGISQELVSKWYFKLLKKNANLNGIRGKQIAQLIEVDLRNPQ